jgi:hypothetical protein
MENCYIPKERGAGTLKPHSVAFIAAAGVCKEVRRYLISLGYAPKCLPRETATDPEQYWYYAEKTMRSEDWQEGDVILRAEEAADVEHVRAALAANINAQAEEVCEACQ